MRRLLVNDRLDTLGDRTIWHDLRDWLGMEFVGGEYATLANMAAESAQEAIQPGRVAASLIIRNATWFPPIKAACPQIALLQDILPEGPQREVQEAVLGASVVVFNSAFTAAQYPGVKGRIIPLPVDFSLFEPGNPMGLQQALGLPDGCVCWVGACREAGHVKGWDIFLAIVRANPDLPFVAVFKDDPPAQGPPNLRTYSRLAQADLARVMGACRVGICTSRMESQHLAGIEMGACGLPMVAPPVGVYWKGHISGTGVADPTVQNYTQAIRALLAMRPDPAHAREFWRRDFDKPVIRAQWIGLVEEVDRDPDTLPRASPARSCEGIPQVRDPDRDRLIGQWEERHALVDPHQRDS